MKWYLYALLLFINSGCYDSKPQQYDSYYRLTVNNVEKSKLNKEHGIFMFYEENTKDINRPFMLGAYVDGFRNGFWEYQVETESIKVIKWAYYKDQHMDIETNLFQEIDTCIYGDDYSTLIFNINREKVKFTLALNSDIIGKVNGENYIQLLKQEFKKVDAEIISWQPLTLGNKPTFFGYKIILKKNKSKNNLYLYSAYAKLKNGTTVDLAVQSNVNNSFYAKVLFDAVVSNIYVAKERVYNPWIID